MGKLLRVYSNKMFVIFSGIILIGITSMTLILSIYLEELYKTQSKELIDELTNKTDNAFQHYFGNMDRMAIQLMTNKNVTRILRSDYDQMPPEDKLSYRKEAEGILMNVISPIFEMRRVSVFSDSTFFTVGVSETKNGIKKVKYEYIEYLKQYFQDQSRDIYISPASTDLWSDNQTELVSFVRCIRYGDGKVGFIEIQQDYDNLYDELQTDSADNAPYIQVNNRDNEKIFSSRKKNKTLQTILKENFIQCLGKEVLNGNGYYYKVSQQNDYQLLIFVAQSKDLLFQYYYRQRTLMITGTLVLLCVLFLTSWYASKRLTRPLRQLKKQMNELNIEKLSEHLEIDADDYDEIKQIYETFNNMNEKLQESISALIESKKLEYRAQRASLQSQISPHFIGNTLTVIGAKGYECGVFAVDEMCVLLSTMMRYITKQSDFCTTIANEVAYTEMYLKLIKYRYEERFDYQIDVDDRIKEVKIPMLIIQPIVENSILYGFIPEKPNLKVWVTGEYCDQEWKIIVKDNGQGFSDQKRKELLEKLKSYESNQELSGLGNVNVGLINSYLRLKLDNNGNNILFDIISNGEFTQVIIGGEIDV